MLYVIMLMFSNMVVFGSCPVYVHNFTYLALINWHYNI